MPKGFKENPRTKWTPPNESLHIASPRFFHPTKRDANLYLGCGLFETKKMEPKKTFETTNCTTLKLLLATSSYYLLFCKLNPLQFLLRTLPRSLLNVHNDALQQGSWWHPSTLCLLGNDHGKWMQMATIYRENVGKPRRVLFYRSFKWFENLLEEVNATRWCSTNLMLLLLELWLDGSWVSGVWQPHHMGNDLLVSVQGWQNEVTRAKEQFDSRILHDPAFWDQSIQLEIDTKSLDAGNSWQAAPTGMTSSRCLVNRKRRHQYPCTLQDASPRAMTKCHWRLEHAGTKPQWVLGIETNDSGNIWA